MSDEDIDKGSRGLDEVGTALGGMKIGIICLTPENLNARWILYEAGALSKTLDAKTRVCTYLLASLEVQNIQPPLGMFQATKAEKEETRRLVQTINKALDGEAVSEAHLNATFDGMWPRLEARLGGIPKLEQVEQTKRSPEDMLAELVEASRADANRRKKTEELDQYLPLLQEILPFMGEALKTVRNAQAHSPIRANISGRGALGASEAVRLEARALARKLFSVKIEYDDSLKKIEGTAAIQEYPGRLVILDGEREVARFNDKVENWWTESLPDESRTLSLGDLMKPSNK
jgi:hypothetical protein